MNYATLSEIKRSLKNKEILLKDLVEEYLSNIEKKNPEINAFLEVYKNEVREKAKDIQEKIDNNEEGKLAGMVLGIKDNICCKGHKVTAASRILEGFESLYNSTAVERLLNEDALIIGRLNCDEFAMGTSNENSGYGVVKN
ncbi:MAG: amidase family protein, partial [Flavobacteriales bacterium]